MYKPGTIVLVPFPFTDLSGEKVRPALILASQTKSEDVLVCFITSAITKNDHCTLVVSQHHPMFLKTGLKTTSSIRVAKLATLDQRVILGEIGHLDQDMLVGVRKLLKAYLHI